MRYAPYRRIDSISAAGIVRLLTVLFLASLALTTGLFASVRFGLTDGDALHRHRHEHSDWRAIQSPPSPAGEEAPHG